MIHIITDLASCVQAEYYLNGEKYIRSGESHILYIYAHGTDKPKLWNILQPMRKKDSLFSVDELSEAIKVAMEAGSNVYIIANSCLWNYKYNMGFTVPTISFGPDDTTRLPFPSENIETRLKKIPDNFTKEFFLEWIQNLNQEYIKHKNLFECYDENGEIVRVKEYRIIQSA
tara:strand:+ start:1548 stop:2063 length:516 start_codon:yes stop_codon:yes gene_type:complete